MYVIVGIAEKTDNDGLYDSAACVLLTALNWSEDSFLVVYPFHVASREKPSGGSWMLSYYVA